MNDRILVCGAWDEGPGYPRPASLLAGLRAAGLAVEECRVPLPYSGRQKQRLVVDRLNPRICPVLNAFLLVLRKISTANEMRVVVRVTAVSYSHTYVETLVLKNITPYSRE